MKNTWFCQQKPKIRWELDVVIHSPSWVIGAENDKQNNKNKSTEFQIIKRL